MIVAINGSNRQTKRAATYILLQKHKVTIAKELEKSSVHSSVLDMIHLIDPVRETCSDSGISGSALKVTRKALHELHTHDKNVETSDQLMVKVIDRKSVV